MMRTFIFLFGMFFCGVVQGQVGLEWAASVGGIGEDYGRSIAIDASGNVYTIGYFQDTVDFDSGSNISNLASRGVYDIFIHKVDVNGNFVWAKSIGGTSYDLGHAIAIDTFGNIYITGYFIGTVDFDPTVGIFNLTSAGNADVFVSKLDANGNFIWAKSMGGPTNGYGYSIAVDLAGNVYTTGAYTGTFDFDPGVGVFNLIPEGWWEIFVSKLDANGNFVWAKSMGGVGEDRGNSLTLDEGGNVYITGHFDSMADFDPGTNIFSLDAFSGSVFITKLDGNGNFIWAKNMATEGQGNAIKVDINNNVYTTGSFEGVNDFDPGFGVYNLSSIGGWSKPDIFISKLDASGNFLWAKSMGGVGENYGYSIALDAIGNVYTTGSFEDTVDFDPGIGVYNLSSPNNVPWAGNDAIFISKLDALGNFIWAKNLGWNNGDAANFIILDNFYNIYTTGYFGGTVDFNPNIGIFNLNAVGIVDFFILKLNQKGISGKVYHDYNQNCTQDVNEMIPLSNRILTITPGNLVVQTNTAGIWSLDSLPAGTYTITADTSSPNWQITCPVTQSFTVLHPDSITVAPSFGFISTNPCTSPDISIHAPFLRPGFSSQNVYVQACNSNLGTAILDSAYVIVELDPLLSVQAGSQAYTALGNNLYRVNVGAIYPGFCVDFWLNCTLSSTAIIGQTLCLNATLYPVDSCALDDIPNPSISCNTPYDFSDLVIRPECNNDTISFVIHNTGDDDMTCFSQVRLYIDGVLMTIDSVQLLSGDTAVFVFAGDGRTWRLEVDQHPFFPGNSQPSATIELCGNASNWTPNLFNILPQNDADPQIDIYCGLVTGSFDPNDKTGYPLGIGTAHDILPNQDIEYVINFQNTGTDTAFTVVIRDTLSTDLDIFSVRSGVSSHDYDFRMYGPRVLEWTFYNIMLPDSNINEPASHGFTTFKVHQTPDLPNGTVIQNSAAIYFDFNAPIFTNTSWHTINDGLILLHTEKERIEQHLQIKIYPNPTTGILHIDKMNHAAIQISVLDNLGRILLTQQSDDTITNLNINHLPTGIYYITINNGKGVMTEKIVKM